VLASCILPFLCQGRNYQTPGRIRDGGLCAARQSDEAFPSAASSSVSF
jgi:hypothetical protein